MKFLRNVFSELKKVKWPNKEYMIKYTIATLAFILLLTCYFLIIESLVALFI